MNIWTKIFISALSNLKHGKLKLSINGNHHFISGKFPGPNADFKIEVIVGPEFLTGSSRLKAGTAQKLILNMISTISMILDGHVRGNKMIDMQMSNAKLNKRARRIIMEELKVNEEKANELILKYKSIRSAIDNFSNE